MALLTDDQRDELRARFEADRSRIWDVIAVDSGMLRAAVDALDTYFEDNAAAINNSLPPTAKTALTTPQKAWLVREVVGVRYGV